MIVILLALSFIFIGGAFAEDVQVYDNNFNQLYTVRESSNGDKVIYDTKWQKQGTIRGGTIYDSKWSQVGIIKGGTSKGGGKK